MLFLCAILLSIKFATSLALSFIDLGKYLDISFAPTGITKPIPPPIAAAFPTRPQDSISPFLASWSINSSPPSNPALRSIEPIGLFNKGEPK